MQHDPASYPKERESEPPCFGSHNAGFGDLCVSRETTAVPKYPPTARATPGDRSSLRGRHPPPPAVVPEARGVPRGDETKAERVWLALAEGERPRRPAGGSSEETGRWGAPWMN